MTNRQQSLDDLKNSCVEHRRRLLSSTWVVLVAALGSTLIFAGDTASASDGDMAVGCGNYFRCVADCPTPEQIQEECMGFQGSHCIVANATCGWSWRDPWGCDWNGSWKPNWPRRVRCNYEQVLA